MDDQPEHLSDLAVPASLAARLSEVADAEHRRPLDVLQDAVDLYIRAKQSSGEPRRTRAEAAARMRQSRSGNTLPEGVTIRDLMTFGRP